MNLSINYIYPFKYISFKPKEYNQSIITSLIIDFTSNKHYSSKPNIDLIIRQINNLVKEDIKLIVIKIHNDLNINVYGIKDTMNEDITTL